MKDLRILTLVLLVSGLGFFSACEPEPIVDTPNQICTDFAFNQDKFADNLKDALDNNVMGYGFIITDEGQVEITEQEGLGRNNADGGTAFHVDKPMHIASISKNITTAAVLKVLKMKNKSLDDVVHPYLPREWKLGPGMKQVTFRELLTHSAGLGQVGTQNSLATRFDSLRAYVQAGVGAPKTPDYSNTNHAMFRVILPRLWDKYRPNGGGYTEEFCASVYEKCIKELVLNPINATGDLELTDNNPQLCYSGPADFGTGGGANSNYETTAGGFGWHMSVTETARYWAYLWNTNIIIDDNARQEMMNDEMGLWNSISGDKGRYYCKLGGWNYGSNKWVRSCVMQFPNGYQVTLIVNSRTQDAQSLRTIASDAFDEAWGCF